MGCSSNNIPNNDTPKERKKAVPETGTKEENHKDKKEAVPETGKKEDIPKDNQSHIPKVATKKEFYYCFDDDEVKIIEEKVNNIKSFKFENYIQLYNKCIIDYKNEKNDITTVKQYKALYVNDDYFSSEDDIICCSEISDLFFDTVEITSFKINNKDEDNPETVIDGKLFHYRLDFARTKSRTI